MSNRNEKWRNVPIDEDNVDEYLYDLVNGSKSPYITQAVSFNKRDPIQMGMLREILLSSTAFSGFIKHVIPLYFHNKGVNVKSFDFSVFDNFDITIQEKPKRKRREGANASSRNIKREKEVTKALNEAIKSNPKFEEFLDEKDNPEENQKQSNEDYEDIPDVNVNVNGKRRKVKASGGGFMNFQKPKD